MKRRLRQAQSHEYKTAQKFITSIVTDKQQPENTKNITDITECKYLSLLNLVHDSVLHQGASNHRGGCAKKASMFPYPGKLFFILDLSSHSRPLILLKLKLHTMTLPTPIALHYSSSSRLEPRKVLISSLEVRCFTRSNIKKGIMLPSQKTKHLHRDSNRERPSSEIG